MKTWKIEIKPTQTGIRIRSIADVRDVQARLMATYIEKCLATVAASIADNSR
jgi:hypothetical protein